MKLLTVAENEKFNDIIGIKEGNIFVVNAIDFFGTWDLTNYVKGKVLEAYDKGYDDCKEDYNIGKE
jgi:hypothetical protein